MWTAQTPRRLRRTHTVASARRDAPADATAGPGGPALPSCDRATGQMRHDRSRGAHERTHHVVTPRPASSPPVESRPRPEVRRTSPDRAGSWPPARRRTARRSELATNATVHTGAMFSVRLEANRETGLLNVRDGSPEPLRKVTASVADTAGRGLTIIGLVSREWGVEEHPDRGKSVWASFTTAAR